MTHNHTEANQVTLTNFSIRARDRQRLVYDIYLIKCAFKEIFPSSVCLQVTMQFPSRTAFKLNLEYAGQTIEMGAYLSMIII